MSAPFPILAPARRVEPLAWSHQTLANGLRVVGIQQVGVPLATLRARIPLGVMSAETSALAQVLAHAFLSGTSGRRAGDLAKAVQLTGGQIRTTVDLDRVVISASSLRSRLPMLVELLAECLTGNTYPDAEVACRRDRCVQQAELTGAEPARLAEDAVRARLFGQHAYGLGVAQPAELNRVMAEDVRRLHARHVVAGSATVVVVGEDDPDTLLEAVTGHLVGWEQGSIAATEDLPEPQVTGRLQLVDRPHAVQTNIRLAGPAPARSHDDHAAFMVANTIYAGYFSSRVVANIRERHGYTYSPGSLVTHGAVASWATTLADVSTEVTAAALNEITYELGRIATTLPDPGEVDAARSYLRGLHAWRNSTQDGLANTAAALLDTRGTSMSWLADYPQALGEVTREAVRESAAAWLAPSRLCAVLVGAAATVQPELEVLGAVETA